jgi:hypothetical protein
MLPVERAVEGVQVLLADGTPCEIPLRKNSKYSPFPAVKTGTVPWHANEGDSVGAAGIAVIIIFAELPEDIALLHPTEEISVMII